MQFQKNNIDKYQKSFRGNRRVVKDNPKESEYGEMAYVEPNVKEIRSPTMEEQDTIGLKDQMDNQQRETPVYHQTFNKNMKKIANKPRLDPQAPTRYNEEMYSGSPKNVINVGSSGDDYEYKMPSLIPRRNQNYNNANNEYNDGNQYEDDEYQDYQNESEIPKTDFYSQNRSPQLGQRFRNNSPPAYGRIAPSNQMSPHNNYEEFNTSTEKNVDPNMNNYNNKYFENRTYMPTQPNQTTYANPNKTIKNTTVLNILRDEIGHKYNNQTYNNMSYKDVKKIANRFSKIYDPHKNDNGLLLEEQQVTLPGAKDEVFNNRYKVLSKMNRLSNILLAQRNVRNPTDKKDLPMDTKTYNRNNSYNSKKPFDRHTLARSPENPTRRAFSRSPNKFLYVSLAMLSSKGPSTEDRPILRWMRLEKGGVVDLAQEERKKNKFKIKKAMPRKGNKTKLYTNPKYRDKAAKVIQNWWRDLKNLYNDRLAKIIKIQSAFRGKFVRKYMYDLFYLNFLYISFCKKIQDVLSKHVRPYVWDKLFGPRAEDDEIPEKTRKLGNLVARDYRNDLNLLLPAWQKWLSNMRKLNMKNNKGRNLVQIRSEKENRLNELRNAFNKWRFIGKVLDAEDKLIESENRNREKGLEKDRQNQLDRENTLKKLKGLFQLTNGIDKYAKKEAMNETLPKLEDYLRNQKGKGKLKKLIYRKPNYNRNLLRKYLYKWRNKALNMGKNDLDEKQRKAVEEYRKKIIKNIITNTRKKQRDNLLKKYLYRWLRKAMLMAMKEEKDKYKHREREYKNKEYETIQKYEKTITIYENEKKENDEANRKMREALERLKTETTVREEELIRIIEETKDTKDNCLLNYLRGTEILQRFCWRRTHPDPLHAMGVKLDGNYLTYQLKKVIKIKKTVLRDLLRKYFDRWKKNALRGINSDVLYKLLAKFIIINSNNFKKKILAKKLNKWRRAARDRPYDSLQRAKDIYDSADILRKVFVKRIGNEFLDRLNKTKNPERYKKTLKKIVRKKDTGKKYELRKAFDKWRNIVKNENVKKLKYKIIYKIYEKTHKDRRKEILNKYFQRWKNKTFKDRIKNYQNDLNKANVKQKNTTRIFVKSIVKGFDKKTRNDLLREHFNHWRRIVNLEKNDKYQNNKKKIMISKIIEKKISNNHLTLLQYLLRWKNRIYELRAQDVHKPYRKKIIRILLTKNDKEELQRCFTKWRYGGLKRLPIMPYIVAKRFLKKVLCRRAFKEFVKKMNERNPNILKKKGRELIKTLTDIKNNRLRDFLKRLIQFIQRKYLGKIQPRIADKIRQYFLKKYFDRWVDNTILYARRRRVIITEILKKKIAELKVKRDKKIKIVLRKLVNGLINSKKLLLSYAFLKYYKNTKLDIQIENARIIQDFCRNKLDNIIKYRIQIRKELAEFLVNLHRKKFFKDLKDFSNQAAPILLERYRSKETKYVKLKITIIDNDRNKKLAILRKYWDIWKNNNGLFDKYSLIIQKKIRMWLAKNKLRDIKKLRELLLKIIILNKDKENELLASRLHQWRKNARLVECIENSKIIQHFCRTKLNNYLRTKLSKYFLKLSIKYITYLIKNSAKIDRLNNVLRYRPLKEGFDAIERKAFKNVIKEVLIEVLSKRNGINNKTILRYYLEKWNKKANQLKNRENILISRLQAAFRGYNFRKTFNVEEKIIQKLTIIIEKLIYSSNSKNILATVLAKWRKNAKLISCEENAKIIQKFCRKIHQDIWETRIQRNQEYCKQIVRIIIDIGDSPRDFFERLKEIRRKKILEELMNKLAKKRTDNLRYVLRKIRNYPKYKYLLRVTKIPNDLRKRILRKYLNNWRNKAMRYKGIMQLLISIINSYGGFKNNLLRYNLKRWSYKAKYLYQVEQAKIIQEFCRDILRKRSVIIDWNRLTGRVKHKNRKNDLHDLLSKLRTVVGLSKLTKTFNNHVRRDIFDTLTRSQVTEIFKVRIIKYFDRNDQKWNKIILKKYLDKWRYKVEKLRNRNSKIYELMDMLEQYRLKVAAETMSDAFLVKKFEHDYPLIRAMDFFNRLFKLSKESNLAHDLITAKKNLEPKKRMNLIQKLYKVYAYKVLNKLFQNIELMQKRNTIPLKEELMKSLRLIVMKKSERRYIERKKNEIVPTNTPSSFRLKKPNTIKDDHKKKLIYVSLAPALLKYLNKYILIKKQQGLDAIKSKSNANKFCELYKRWAEKQELKPKKELVDKLKRIHYNVTSEGLLLLKLFKMLRRAAIRRLLKKSPKIRKVMKLIYTTRVLILQRELAKERFLRQLIRRWRYLAFSKKLAMNKMKTIYKSLHMTYLEMANSLFGENRDDPSVIKEFERFGTSVGMWENEKPHEKEEEKYVKTIKTQYVFDSEDFKKFQDEYYPAEKEEEEIIEEEVKETTEYYTQKESKK